MNALLELVEWFIEPVYRFLSPTRFNGKKINIVQFPLSNPDECLDENSDDFTEEELKPYYNIDCNKIGEDLEQTKLYNEFFEQLIDLCALLGNVIGSSPILFCKVCRILKFLMKKSVENCERIKSEESDPNTTLTQEQIAYNKEMLKLIDTLKNKIKCVIKDVVLPSMTLFEANPGFVALVWSIVSQFDYFDRYAFYEDWMLNQIYKNPDVLLNIGHSIAESQQFMKIVRNDKEVDKLNARQFARISHCCPWGVLNEALIQLKTFNNLIPVIITAMNYSSMLTLDLIVFLALRHLSESGKVKLREEDAMIDNWLTNIATFLGTLLKKHYKIELRGIFVYLCNRLLSEEDLDHLDTVLFKELLSKMTGLITIDNHTDNQIRSLTGGIALQTETFLLTESVRSSKKSSKALADFFWKTSKSIHFAPEDIQSLESVWLSSGNGEVKAAGMNGDSINDCLEVNQEPSCAISEMKIEISEKGLSLSLPFYLLALLGKQRSKVAYLSHFSRCVVISNLYDKLSDTIQQFHLFLRFQLDSPAHYEQ